MSIVFKACPTVALVFAQNLASIFALYLVLLLVPQVGSAHAQTIMRAAKVGWVDWVRSTAFLPSAEAYCSAVLTSPVAPGLAIFWQPHPACIVSDVSTFVWRPSVLQTVFHIADPDNLAYCHSVSYPNYPLGIPCSYTNDQFHVRREAYCPPGFIMTGQIANGSAYGLFSNLTYFDLLGIRDVYSTSVGIGGAPICILNATDPDKNANDCPTCGNPIHPGFGNKTQAEIDYSVADSNLRFIRNYNSVFTQGALIVEGYFGPPTQKTGTRWRTNYQRTVSVTGNAALTTAAVTRPDGNTISFNQSGADWIGDPDIKVRLIELKDAQDNRTGWKYITSDDDIEQYDSNGKLLTLQNRSGIKQTLAYSDANTPVNIAPFAG